MLSPPFINIPFSAPLPVPTIIAVGVASPNAHGHAITSTDRKIVRTNSKSLLPTTNQSNAANKDITITTGTKYPDTVSAEFC